MCDGWGTIYMFALVEYVSIWLINRMHVVRHGDKLSSVDVVLFITSVEGVVVKCIK